MILAWSASSLLAIILSFHLFILLISRMSILVCANCPAVIIESPFYHSQKYACLDDKLYMAFAISV